MGSEAMTSPLTSLISKPINASPAHLVMPPWRAEVRGQADDTVDGICVSGFILHYLWHECSLPLFDPVKVIATTTTEPQWPQTHHKHLSIHYCSSYLTCKGLSAAGTCSVVSPCLYGCPITWYQEDSLISPRRKPSTDSSGSERITQGFFCSSVPGNLTRELLAAKNRCWCCL